jgi:hypothetical protein
MHRAAAFALWLLLSATPAAAQECIEFAPDEGTGFSIRNVGAAITSVFGFWGYWYGENSVAIDSVPREAQLELFYIRQNFQKRFMRVEPPVRLCLPARIMATRRDALTVRVNSPGFSTREWTFPVLDVPERVVLTLDPLPNALVFLGHTHLANRTTLTLRTLKEPEFRVSKSRGQAGFTLALAKTAKKLSGEPSLTGGRVTGVEVAQVGEDVLVAVATDAPDVEARSKQSYDPIRKEFVFSLDLVAPGARLPGPDEIRRELEIVAQAHGDRCALAIEATLRARLEPEVVARAHRPSGGVADLYQRQAMLQVGRADHGTVQTVGGETLRTGNPLELEMALQSAGSVKGYLATLAAWAQNQPDPETTMRSLVAPELTAEEFAPIWSEARGACGR